MAPVNAYGLTSLGTGHTAFSLVAVAVGLYLLVRYREITAQTLAGKVYVVATLVTVLSGFGIFQHGGFGKPHTLGVITLIGWRLRCSPPIRACSGARHATSRWSAIRQLFCST